jgi:predicted MFS family arabinose efflux permease
VLALLSLGVAAALQLGKVPPALLAIAAEFGVGLPWAAALLSSFAFVAALAGLAAGLAAARAGERRALLGGAAVLGAAGLGAAAAPSLPWLYAARAVEGLAYLALTVSAPTLLAARVAERDRNLALSLWSTFMPAGISLGMLAAPLLDLLGWRAVWAGSSVLVWAALLAALFVLPRQAGGPARAEGALGAAVLRLFRARLPLLVALCFGAYALTYFGIAGFLPAFLMDAHGVGLGVAGLVGALAAVANLCGNLAAARMMRAGVAPSRIVLLLGVAMAVLAAASYALPLPWSAAFAVAVAASGIGGAVPASLFALVPRSVPEAGLTGPAMGLVIQCNNLGQLVGPLMIAAAAEAAWPLVALPLLAAGTVLLLAARPLQRIG